MYHVAWCSWLLWKHTSFHLCEQNGIEEAEKGAQRGRRRRMRLTKQLRTHQVLADVAGADLDVVPQDEQDQEEGQHAELPVPHSYHEHLQARGQRRSETRRNSRIMKTFSTVPESPLSKG